MAKYVRTRLNFTGETELLKQVMNDLADEKEKISFARIIPLAETDLPEEKWGVADDAEETDAVLYRNGTALEFLFDTIKKAPVPVYHKLAEMYPQLHMKAEYAYEEYGVSCGTYESEAGSSEALFSEPDEPIIFACEVWDVDPDEVLAEESINYYEE